MRSNKSTFAFSRTVNGEYVLFYERVATGTKSEGSNGKNEVASLLDGLKASGLKTVTREQVEVYCLPVN